MVLAVRIPQADDAVEVGGGQRLAIGRRRQHTNAAVVSRYVPALLSVGDVPELQDAILAGGGERPGIAGKGRPGDDAFMGSQRGLRLQLHGVRRYLVHFTALGQTQHVSRAIRVGGGEVTALGSEGDAVYATLAGRKAVDSPLTDRVECRVPETSRASPAIVRA